MAHVALLYEGIAYKWQTLSLQNQVSLFGCTYLFLTVQCSHGGVIQNVRDEQGSIFI